MDNSEKIYFGSWYIMKTPNGKYGLAYDKGLIEEFGALIQINKEVFDVAKSANWTLEELHSKYDLKRFKKLATIGVTVHLKKTKEDTPNKFYGRGFILTKEKKKYFLEYQLARHGGGSRKFEIEKEVYKYARNGEVSTNDIFKKFNLYHRDVSENDVK